MTPRESAGIKQAFSESMAPMLREVEAIHTVLDEHTGLLESIDEGLTRVESIFDTVEVLFVAASGQGDA
jgi:hypothetical protein